MQAAEQELQSLKKRYAAAHKYATPDELDEAYRSSEKHAQLALDLRQRVDYASARALLVARTLKTEGHVPAALLFDEPLQNDAASVISS